MKAIVQRVVKASVVVDGKVVSEIGNGLCVLVGIGRKSAPKEAEWLAKKILSLRLFDDGNGRRWDKNVMDKKFEVLCVSQFTLYVQMKGNRPDFHDAMAPEASEKFYGDFIQMMKRNYADDKIKDGVFGAMMVVHIENDGPVTIPLESPDNLPEPKVRKWQVNQKTNKDKKDKNNSQDSSAGRTKETTGNCSTEKVQEDTEDSSVVRASDITGNSSTGNIAGTTEDSFAANDDSYKADFASQDLSVESLSITSPGASGSS